MRDPGLPIWVKALATVFFPALVAAYLLGMLPFLQSPLSKIIDSQQALATALGGHERTTDALLQVQRLTCRGVWRGQPEMQEECGR